MAQDRLQPGFFDKANKWWQTDTAKAVATIVAVLLIPGAVVALNYASQNQEATDEVANSGEESEKPEGQNGQTGGIQDVNTLPGVGSTLNYIVKEGDTIYSISYKICGDDSFYKKNIATDHLELGETIVIHCE